MGTSSIVIESKDFPERKHEQDHGIVVKQEQLVKSKTFEIIRRRLHRQFLEVFKSGLLVFAFLAVYKITGLHVWWIQFVDKILSIPH